MSNMGVRYNGSPHHQYLGNFLDLRSIVDHDDDDDDDCSKHKQLLFSSSQIIENHLDEDMYKNIIVTGRSLGEGGYGQAFPALYKNPDVKNPFMKKCVVKFPILLIKKGIIRIEANGRIDVFLKHEEDRQSFKMAVRNFEDEWKHSFILRFGRGAYELGLDQSQWKITGTQFWKAQCDRMKLKHHSGFENIHSIQGIDLHVPLIISDFFDGTLDDLSRLSFMKYDPDMMRQYMYQCIIPQTYAGLRFMHVNAKLAHMDIKPQNMLYRYVQGKLYPQVVLSDFGCCEDANTKLDYWVGTVAFMAPEVRLLMEQSTPMYVPKYTDAFSWALSMMMIIHPTTIEPDLDKVLLYKEKTKPSTFSLNDVDRKIFKKIVQILSEDPKQRYKTLMSIRKLLGSQPDISKID